ncbi:multiprotein-bridging factor 1 family protein [Aestuariivirga sp.]|uniref:helix-turn-helix domain-containing protein n=1 Tax=Aestuariivirga sp. TaxID=2650926 RepID=UPI0035940680
MRYAEQLRAARALLGWTQDQLAAQSGVGIATIRRMEAQNGPIRAISDTVWRLQSALERAGVVFFSEDGTHGPGVRLAGVPKS